MKATELSAFEFSLISNPPAAPMVYRKISKDIKERAMFLYQNGWPLEELAAILGVSEKSIGWWADILEKEGDVIRASSHLHTGGHHSLH